jgi:hypothetical protein
MRVLIGCEFSGTVRDAFRAKGHDAWSCDLLPSPDGSPFHIHGSLFDADDGFGQRGDVTTWGWDLAIFHPPCTYLTSAGLHWNKRRPGRAALTDEAVAFVMQLAASDIPRIAIENPVGCLSTRWRRPSQIVQPYQFGDDASKATCLWLKGLPLLRPTTRYPGRQVSKADGSTVERWSNQTDSGQNRLAPSADRWALRSLTYPGIAAAMADQWG